MKLTIAQLLESQTALSELAQDKRLPVKTSYWCAKVLRKAATENEDYHTARIKLCETHGVLDKQAGKFTAADGSPLETNDEFQKQIGDLLSMEIELPGEPFTLEGLGATTISAASMMALEWLIVE